MKKTSLLVLGILFIAGCSMGEENLEVQTVLHQPVPLEIKEKERYEHEFRVVDPRDNHVVEVFKPVDFQNEEALRERAINLASELATTIDRPMIPMKVDDNGVLTEGQSRMILHEDELVDEIMDVSFFNKEIVLPITETHPNVTTETIQGIDEEILGSFTTYFDPNVTGRNFNIAKSASEIDGVVLGPGDRFYFNTVVGNASKENGYKMATVIVNQQFVPGYGGGVCQTSSTLYNAVAEAGLEILELHHHSKSVGYVPIGKDATVAYGFKDFKFANNRPYPVMIKTNVNESGGMIEVQILSAANYVSN